ncbi:MAG: hypothetical protein ACM3KJ_02895, partial [Bacillota bacterium]
ASESAIFARSTGRSATAPPRRASRRRSRELGVLFDEGFIALRPSGTEPKIKLYVSLKCPNFDDVAQKINAMIFS